jgi:putative membrane protein
VSPGRTVIVTSNGRERSVPFFIRMLVQSIAILLIAYLLPPLMTVDGFLAALAAAFVLGLANAVLRPVFVILTLPLTLLTFGLFLLVINGLLLWLVATVVPGVTVNGFWGALGASVLVSLVSWVLSRVVT